MGIVSESRESEPGHISPVESSESHDSALKNARVDAEINATQAAADLEKIKRAHQWDPNLPQEKVDILNKVLRDGDAEEIIEVDELFTENSPYEEVRAAVRNTDSEGVANTVRAWVLGMIFVTIGSGLNMFLSMR